MVRLWFISSFKAIGVSIKLGITVDFWAVCSNTITGIIRLSNFNKATECQAPIYFKKNSN